MQDRLLEIGRWLSVNGEAIYGTRRWERMFQWSAGKQDYRPEGQHYLGGDFILKQTIDPEPGYAVKELFFTTKGENLYAIAPTWPGKQLIIKNFNATDTSEATLLGLEQKLVWSNVGNDLIIEMPESNLNLPELSHHAYVVRITGN